MVKTQRKIAKRARRDGYYTREMLTRGSVVGKAMKGLNPDRDREQQLKSWLRRHRPKKKLSDAEREKLRVRFAEVRSQLPLFSKK